LQDENNNAPIEITSWRNTNLTAATYTKYDYSINPPLGVYPKTFQKINLGSTSSTFTISSNTSSAVTKDSRYADESNFSFSKGNPVQITPHDGIANSYIWDYLNSEPVAKASNAPTSQIAYSSFEADGKGSWTFTGVPDLL